MKCRLNHIFHRHTHTHIMQHYINDKLNMPTSCIINSTPCEESSNIEPRHMFPTSQSKP